MNFKFYVKNRNRYEKREYEAPTGANMTFFKKLLLSIKEQTDTIRKDIMQYQENNENKNLSHPSNENPIIQKKLDILVKMRKENLFIEESISNLLKENEFIICPWCKHKMYKMPNGVDYDQIGNSYILREYIPNIRYIYLCENCIHAIQAEFYPQLMEMWNSKPKEKLIQDEFGYHMEQ